jgi:hypothetical protein
MGHIFLVRHTSGGVHRPAMLFQNRVKFDARMIGVKYSTA